MTSTSHSSPIEIHQERLLLEAALASDALGHGLTALRRYDFADKGRFFSGMFALTIGLERVLKLVFLINEVNEHCRFPDNRGLKNIGHDICQLVAQARLINDTKSLGIDHSKIEDVLCQEILKLMSTFARRTRYYNLDALTGATGDGDEEPLAAWDRIVGTEVVNRHYRVTRKQREELAFAKSLTGVPGVVVWHTLEDGSHVRDFTALARAAMHIETKQKYSVYYVLCIIEFCVDVLVALARRQPSLSYLHEYFRIFNTLDRRTVLRKKNWSPPL